jgi:hypothetical protein
VFTALRVAAAVTLVTLLWQSLVGAQAPADGSETGELAVHLELVAPPGCADEADLIRRISLRSRRIRFVPAASDVRSVRAELRVSDRSVTTTLTLRSASGTGSSSRTVQARSCDDAVEATALVTAVMLDPAALTGELPTESDAGADVAPSASTSAVPTAFPPVPTEKPPPPRPPPPKRGSAEASAAVTGEGLVGPSPGLMIGAGIAIAVRWQRDSIWSPMARVTPVYLTREGVQTPLGEAEFTLLAVRLELCPLRLGGPALSLYTCAMGFYGNLTSHGQVSGAPASENVRPFGAVGGSLLLAPLGVANNVELMLGVSLGFVPNRDIYAVEDPVTLKPRIFHEVSPVAGSGGLAFGVRFP